MWIMGCDKKELTDARFFKVQKNVGGGKDKKWALIAYSQTTAAVTLTGVVCAYFSEEDRAVMELEKVAAFMEENPGKIYRFSN